MHMPNFGIIDVPISFGTIGGGTMPGRRFHQIKVDQTAKTSGKGAVSAIANERRAAAMTIDEQEVGIARLRGKRSEARRRRVLEGELRMAGKSLYDIGGALKHLSGTAMGNRVDYILPKFAAVPAICDLGRVKEMLEELKELQTLLDQLNHSASQMGID